MLNSFRALVDTWNQNTLLILDIDSTLLLTHKRNEAILHRFAQEHENIHSDFCSLLKTVECKACEYGYGSALKRVGLHTFPEEQLTALATYWRKHFFSNEYLHQDILHKGALDFVNYLRERGVPHVYLTGRPEPLMVEGTLKTLNDFGFQVQPERLFMKPQAAVIDEKFKSDKIAELKKRGMKLVLIDNEPKILNQVLIDHPDVEIVFVDTCHSENVRAPSHVPWIKDFSEFITR